MLSNSVLAIATTLLLSGCSSTPATLSQSSVPALSPTPVELTQRPIASTRLGLAGLRVGSPETNLRSLGTPTRDRRESSPNYEVLRSLTYANGLRVTVADGAIAGISTDRSQFTTLDGVRVGDDRNKVIATYGQAEETSGEENYSRLSYSDDQGGYLVFELRGDTVVAISTGWLLD